MQVFETCMSATCALDAVTVQQTLSNVQQVCASCTPDGCNSFVISAGGNGGGTIFASTTVTQAPVSMPSLCYTTTQSAWTSSVGGGGGAVGGGFFSAGPVPCADSSSNNAASSSGTPLSSSGGVSLPDAASASDTASPSGVTSASSAAPGLGYPYALATTAVAAVLAIGLSLGGTLLV
ncbi:hypothetical protein FB451DRAFT_1239228 [Mycena latifolia]|nr:hypothetical protein FB451DRAFT_1239228 [Mycena latifolia]